MTRDTESKSGDKRLKELDMLSLKSYHPRRQQMFVFCCVRGKIRSNRFELHEGRTERRNSLAEKCIVATDGYF